MTTHVHESPREVLLKHATDAAVICRRHGNEDRARLWDLEAAKLQGSVDSPADMHRRLADIYEQGGAVNVAQQHRAVADSMDRFNAAFEDAERTVKAFPTEVEKIAALHEQGVGAPFTDDEIAALHEPQGPPVDGREVDRAPDVLTVKAIEDLRDAVRSSPPRLLHAVSPQEAAALRTPQTDGGVPTDPPRASTPSSPHATKEN